MEKQIILHVEDDADAAYFLKRALQKANLDLDLRQLKDGEEAIRYLASQPPFNDRSTHPAPHIILLDLKMPLKDGFDVLSWIKENPPLTSIPVIVLTSSDREADIQRAKTLGATAFLTKTISYGNVVQALQSYSQN